MKIFLLLTLISFNVFCQSYLNGRDMIILEKHDSIKSDAGDEVRVVTDLVNDKLQTPLDLNVNGNTLSIGASELQLYKSDQANNNVIQSVKKGLSPIELSYLSIAESTLNVSTGAVTGDFDASPSAPTVSANEWVWIGFELNTSGKIVIVAGSPNATKGSATYPVWTGNTPLGMTELQAESSCGGTGDAGWNFFNPLETDIVFFSGTGSGGSGGDTSFKCLNGSTTAKIVVKKGKIRVNGIEYEKTSDFSELTIASELTDDATNYIYFDVTDQDLYVDSVSYENQNGGFLRRYAPLCEAIAASGAISSIHNYAYRNYDAVLHGDEDICYSIMNKNANTIISENPYLHNLGAEPKSQFCKEGTIYNTTTGLYTKVGCESFIDNTNATYVSILPALLDSDEELSLKMCYRTNIVGTTKESWDTCKTGTCWITNAIKPFNADATFTFTNPFQEIPLCQIQVNSNGTFSPKNTGEAIKSMSTSELVINATWTNTLNTTTDSYKILCGLGADFGALDTNPTFGTITSGDIITTQATIAGVQTINSSSPLDPTYFPTMANTNVYAAHINGTSDFDGTAWSGGINLTEIGSLTQGANHLGTTVYNTGDGNDGAYLTGVPAGQNTNFSAGGWFKINDISSYRTLISRFSGTNSEKSFYVGISTTGLLQYRIYYDASSGTVVDIPDFDISAYVNDGKFHFVGISYKYVSSSEAYKLLMFDDTVVGYIKKTTNTARNDDGGAEITIGGQDTTGQLHGSVSDSIFIQGTNAWLTPNQWRKIACAGNGQRCEVDRNGEVRINGKQKVSMFRNPTDAAGLSSDTIAEITDWNILLPEAGQYNTSFQFGSNFLDVSANGVVQFIFYIFNNDAELNTYSRQLSYWQGFSAGINLYVPFNITGTRFVGKTNDRINLRYMEGATSTDTATASYGGIYLQKD